MKLPQHTNVIKFSQAISHVTVELKTNISKSQLIYELTNSMAPEPEGSSPP